MKLCKRNLKVCYYIIDHKAIETIDSLTTLVGVSHLIWKYGTIPSSIFLDICICNVLCIDIQEQLSSGASESSTLVGEVSKLKEELRCVSVKLEKSTEEVKYSTIQSPSGIVLCWRKSGKLFHVYIKICVTNRFADVHNIYGNRNWHCYWCLFFSFFFSDICFGGSQIQTRNGIEHFKIHHVW